MLFDFVYPQKIQFLCKSGFPRGKYVRIRRRLDVLDSKIKIIKVVCI